MSDDEEQELLDMFPNPKRVEVERVTQPDRLQQILDTMDVPELRRTDWGWLGRNLIFNNGTHPDFTEAMQLIAEKRKEGTQPWTPKSVS